MFKKTVIIASAMALCITGLTGCGSATAEKNDKLSVVCTIFPEYDWTKEILGSHAQDCEVTYLLSNGADLHNYQPTVDDMITISKCDVFIYVGGESESWVDDALSEARNKNMKVLSLMDSLDGEIKEEELREGMEAEEEEDEEEEGPEYDEHIWLSLRNAEKCVSAIAGTLAEADPVNASDYRANADSYSEKIAALDAEFSEMLSSANNKTLIFGDRFPFRYFVDDYGLDYYAAFVGCSAETEASFETIAFLAEKADMLGCKSIFAIEGSDCSIAEAVISSTKSKSQQIAVLDSVQSVSLSDADSGDSYLGKMEQNYNVLKEALN